MSYHSKKNGRRKPMAEINVVPYIDVTLVLLIIVMITTPMLQTGVDVDLPEAESKKWKLKAKEKANQFHPSLFLFKKVAFFTLRQIGQKNNLCSQRRSTP